MLACMVFDLLASGHVAGGNMWKAWYTGSTFQQQGAAWLFESAHRATIFDWRYAQALRVKMGAGAKPYAKILENKSLTFLNGSAIFIAHFAAS